LIGARSVVTPAFLQSFYLQPLHLTEKFRALGVLKDCVM
jgi:hypothetical protein